MIRNFVVRGLSMLVTFAISFFMLAAPGCRQAPPPAVVTPAPKNVAKIREVFMNSAGDTIIADGSPVITTSGADIMKIEFNRGYQLQDSAGAAVGVNGITILEKVHIHKNTTWIGANDISVNSINTFRATFNVGGAPQTLDGVFGDSPSLEKIVGNTNVAMPDGPWELDMTRIFYVMRDGNKVAIGGNRYIYKRDKGDNAAAVKTKSVMEPVYLPTSVDDVQGAQ